MGSSSSVFDLICQITNYIINTVGLWLVFRKCGISGAWALVPFGRDYKLAICADMEDEGTVYCLANTLGGFFLFALQLMQILNKTNSATYFLCSVIALVFAVINLIYGIRILSELCRRFGQKKRWIWAWLFADGITALIWGLSKKFMPIIPTISNKLQAAEESGIEAAAVERGLTINIKERTARNHFKTKTLLKDIHMSIEPGNMVLLLGGSGAGKTTFVNAVTGYEKADASILLNGIDVYEYFNKMKYEIGFVPQQDLIRYEYPVFRTLYDAANLKMPTNCSHSEKIARVNEVIEMFGLGSVKNNIVGKQSGGQKKRISIASEFVSDPMLFFLDEPDSGLDGIMARDLMQRLHDISRQGKIIVVITHTPDRVLDLFDKVIVLGKDADRTGRLVFYGSIEEAKAFFEVDKMESIIKKINREDEGGDGKSDELIAKYAEVCNARA